MSVALSPEILAHLVPTRRLEERRGHRPSGVALLDELLGGGWPRAALAELRGRLLIQPKNPRQWITEDGEFDLLIGASSIDIRGALTVTLQSTLKLPSLLSRESTPRDWLDDPRGKVIFEPMFQQMTAQMKQMQQKTPELAPMTEEQQQAYSRVLNKFMERAMNLNTSDEMLADMSTNAVLIDCRKQHRIRCDGPRYLDANFPSPCSKR